MTTTAEMTAYVTKLRCGYQEGMTAFERPETEAAAARARAFHPTYKAYHEAGHGVVGVALGALSLRRLVMFEEGVGPSAPAPEFGGLAQWSEGGQERSEHICACRRSKLMAGALTCAGPAGERKFRLAGSGPV
jgi:predicted PhzF superfamily epimerase YddE/YHI9